MHLKMVLAHGIKNEAIHFIILLIDKLEVVTLPLFYDGKIDEGKRAIEPLRSLGQPHGEEIGPQPYVAWQKAFDPMLTPGARNYWKSHNFSELSDGAIDTMIEYASELPSPQSEIFA
jgi:hypothetical protein